jgi:hypothetical protein
MRSKFSNQRKQSVKDEKWSSRSLRCHAGIFCVDLVDDHGVRRSSLEDTGSAKVLTRFGMALYSATVIGDGISETTR